MEILILKIGNSPSLSVSNAVNCEFSKWLTQIKFKIIVSYCIRKIIYRTLKLLLLINRKNLKYFIVFYDFFFIKNWDMLFHLLVLSCLRFQALFLSYYCFISLFVWLIIGFTHTLIPLHAIYRILHHRNQYLLLSIADVSSPLKFDLTLLFVSFRSSDLTDELTIMKTFWSFNQFDQKKIYVDLVSTKMFNKKK